MKRLARLLLLPITPVLGFGGPDPPPVQQVNTVGRDANDAKASADAAELERRRLQNERGQAANVLGGDKLKNETAGKPTLLSGLPK